MKKSILTMLILATSLAAHSKIIESELHLSGSIDKNLNVSIEVYAESTNRTRPDLTIDGWKQVPLISDKNEAVKVSSSNTFKRTLESNWTTMTGTNYQAKLYRIHLTSPGYSEDSIEIYIDENCKDIPGVEAGNTLEVVKKTNGGSKYLGAKIVKKSGDVDGVRYICISPEAKEAINYPLNIVLK